ncbi:hypothetical protein F5I97DRAFT_750930 [Phlebopus sp. FC_14]|nr:hypothetical protein F5I97DRAFT_750930 [Phlebopus sp. FC_14]
MVVLLSSLSDSVLSASSDISPCSSLPVTVLLPAVACLRDPLACARISSNSLFSCCNSLNRSTERLLMISSGRYIRAPFHQTSGTVSTHLSSEHITWPACLAFRFIDGRY